MEKVRGWYKGVILLIVFLFICSVAHAEPIYCMNCKKLLYDYLGKIERGADYSAKYFIPAGENIPWPKESDKFVCPICKCPLNGWLAWAWVGGYKEPRLSHPDLVSLMTKDKEGNLVWKPWDVNVE